MKRLIKLLLGTAAPVALAACSAGTFDNPTGTTIRVPIVVGEDRGTIIIGADGSITGEGIVNVDGTPTRVVTIPR